MKNSCFFLVVLVALSSCASSYKPMVRHVGLLTPESSIDILLGYRYEVLMDSRNKKYAKKEIPLGIRVVAVEVTNESDQPITIGQDVELYAGALKAEILSPAETVREMKQQGGWYMFWSALWIFITNCDDGRCSVIPLPIGVIIGLTNMSTAKSANRSFLQDLTHRDLMGKTIDPGETRSGLMTIRTSGSPVLTLKRTSP